MIKQMLVTKLKVLHIEWQLVNPEEKTQVLAFTSFTSEVMSVPNPLNTCREVLKSSTVFIFTYILMHGKWLIIFLE